MLADRQAQPQAAKLASVRSLELFERIKNTRLILLCDTNACVDYADAYALRCALRLERHGAGISKFDGVSQEVEEYLREAVFVGDYCR